MVNLSKQYRRRLLLLLSLIFVLQGVFPLAAHTQLVRDNQGKLVQICTIEGTKSYRLDNGNPLGGDHQPDTYRSAAIEFSGLLAEIVLETPEPLFILTELVVHVTPPRFDSVVSLRIVSTKLARAPPVSFV